MKLRARIRGEETERKRESDIQRRAATVGEREECQSEEDGSRAGLYGDGAAREKRGVARSFVGGARRAGARVERVASGGPRGRTSMCFRRKRRVTIQVNRIVTSRTWVVNPYFPRCCSVSDSTERRDSGQLCMAPSSL